MKRVSASLQERFIYCSAWITAGGMEDASIAQALLSRLCYVLLFETIFAFIWRLPCIGLSLALRCFPLLLSKHGQIVIF